MIDDVNNPYILLGTFQYPDELITANILKWNFITNKLTVLVTLQNTNSIRRILRYNDYIFFSSENDVDSQIVTAIYTGTVTACTINNLQNTYKTINLQYELIQLKGSVWDFSLSGDTIYISIPIVVPNDDKFSGFSTYGRLYYTKIKNILYNNSGYCKLLAIVGGNNYIPGFGINSISTFQVQTSNNSNLVYIYTLSDFVYQLIGITLNGSTQLAELISNIQSFVDFVNFFRIISAQTDIDGYRVFTINKCDLYKSTEPIITTIIGDAPLQTIDNSLSSNGINNFFNIYCWTSTNYVNEFYFGTLDIRSQLYILLISIISNILQIDIEILLNLPEQTIILLTDFFYNPNSFFPSLPLINLPIDLPNKQLYFDVFTIKNLIINKFTSSGYNKSSGINSFGYDGVRNLNVINNKNGKFLLTGTTCYQVENTAAVFIKKL